MSSMSSIFGTSSIDYIVAQYMAIERQPITALEDQQSLLSSRLWMYAELQSRLYDLRNAAHDLSSTLSSSTFNLRTATSSDTDILTAVASSGSAMGTYSILVTQLAKNDTVLSDVFTDSNGTILSSEGAGAKSFTISVNGVDTTVNVTLSSGEDDETVLNNVAQAINDSGADVTASVIHVSSTTSRLEIKSDETGSTYTIGLADVSGTLLSTLGLDESVAATDTQGGSIYTDKSLLNAELDLDGISITRDSNSISDVIDGVTINLVGYQNQTDIPVTLTISSDVDGIQAEIEDFITKYNDAIDYLNENMAVDPDNSVRGMLAGNFTFTNLRSNLRSIVSGFVSTVQAGNPELLSQVGITIDEDGRLSLSDEEEFANAIEEDPSQVGDLFNTSGGIAVQLDTLLYDYVKTGGFIDDIEESVNNQVDFIDTRIGRMEDRLAIREDELRRELYDLQSMLASLTSQQSYMQQFYGSIMANMG